MKFEPEIPIGDDGLIYKLPQLPAEKNIPGYKLASAKQKFVRQNFLTDADFKKLSKESQLEILTTELNRRVEGYWFFNNGVPTYLTGSHYFYLNYWYIAALTNDGLPEYRWAMNKISYFADLCEKDNSCFGGILLAQKRSGKTEFFLADLYNYATLIETDCLFGMQSLSATEAKNNLFKGRVIRSHRRIPNYLKPKSNDSKGVKEISSELKFMREKNGDYYKQGLDNIIDWRPTHESAYQGKRPRKIYWDEAGSIIEMQIYDALSTVKQQLQIGKKAFGKIFMPATLEEITTKGAPLFQKIWQESNPNKRDANGRTESWLYRYFNPQYEGREDFIDPHGNSLVDEAKKFRSNELEIATPSKQKKIKRQYPESVEEAFDVVVSNFWESDVREILSHMRKQLMNQTPPMVKKVKLFQLGTGELHYNAAKNDDETAVFIFEDPKPHVKYYASFDGTASDKETGNEYGSKVSVTILKGPDAGEKFEYLPVAYFNYRPDKMTDGYRSTLGICKHYGQFGNLKMGIERNAGQGAPLIAHFINNGCRKMLMKKQRIVGINDGNDSDLYGWYRTDDVVDVQRSYANEFIRNYGHNIPFLDLIESLIEYGRSNQDFATSFIGCIYTMGDPMSLKKKKTMSAPTMRWKNMGIAINPQGETFENWVQVPG